MIKFLCGDEREGAPKLMGIGLTDKNLEYLKAGHPIQFSMAEVLGQGVHKRADLNHLVREDNVFIFYGKNEATILKDFKERGWIGPETAVRGEVEQ